MLHPDSLGLVLDGPPIGILADLTDEFEEASRRMVCAAELVDEEKDINVGTKVALPTEMVPKKSIAEGSQAVVVSANLSEVGAVRETLSEVFADAEASFPISNAVKTSP